MGAVRFASATKQQAQIIVDFSHGTDRGTRVVRRGFLID